MTSSSSIAAAALEARVAALDWQRVEAELDEQGCAKLGSVLSAVECAGLASLYAESSLFRSRVVMARHNYGRGEYQYFGYPLPPRVEALRALLYQRLAPIANRWMVALREGSTFPAAHADYLAHCHAAGQSRPTPLLLRYGAGDYNCLHQDLYGELVFPLQVVVLLSQPERDFQGGEIVLTEQRPRMQSRAMVFSPTQGEALAFAVRHRPAKGARGVHRVQLRHGVSRVHAGERMTLGLIFHDAA